jgi:serine/threonine protein kinase
MGTVWSAYDEFLHRPVAVKEVLLPPGVPVEQADELRERTLREARAIAVLSHPNVIILHDVAREDGEPFVVMELLPSRSLAHLLRDHGPLNVEQAAAVGNAVAAALEAAHAAGITHRDVKPGNVLVAGDGRIKLTDFGIARNVSEATMTRTGIMLGSPAYIAPEVASGGPVTPAADLWGLGATLFAAVEGHPPYDANGDPLETVGKVVHGEVPKPTPGPLADVISALMDKEPTARLSLREVRHRLHSLQPKTPHDLFPPELFRTPEGKRTSVRMDATDTQVIKTVSPPEVQRPASDSAKLATEPGPLPFLTAPAAGAPAGPPAGPPPTPPPVGRGTRAKAAVAVAVVLLFVVAAGGGFGLARTLGGKSIAPPRQQAARPPGASAPMTTRMVTQQSDAGNPNGSKGGLFSVDVPEKWAKFVTLQPTGRLSPSTLVEFVSPDGRQSLGVQRFSDYFMHHGSEDDYVNALKSTFGPDDVSQRRPLTGDRQGVQLIYQALERATPEADPAPTSANTLRRSTFANIFRLGNSLWVVSVTVPAEQEGGGADLFNRVAGSFNPRD